MGTNMYRELVQALLTGSMVEHNPENATEVALCELEDIWPRIIEELQNCLKCATFKYRLTSAREPGNSNGLYSVSSV